LEESCLRWRREEEKWLVRNALEAKMSSEMRVRTRVVVVVEDRVDGVDVEELKSDEKQDDDDELD
jgi:hypothetical protein